LNKENRLVGFLWHQGEHDASERADYDVTEIETFYYEQFKALLTDFRARYEQYDLPVVAAGFVDECRVLYEKQCEAVCTGMKRVFAEIGYKGPIVRENNRRVVVMRVAKGYNKRKMRWEKNNSLHVKSSEYNLI
jgi:hypothetical protein